MSEPLEKKAKLSVILGYWNIRGLAQPIRLLLKYSGTDFDDKRYTQGDGPDFSREEWTSVKSTLGLDFPNLPYLIDGDLKITQCNSILAYIGRKNKLGGNTESEMATVDMLANVIMDFRGGFVKLCYNSNMESMKKDYITKARNHMKAFSDYLGERNWITGAEITYADFHLYEMLDQHKLLEASLFDGLDNLKAYMQRFESLPAIKEYMSSAEFLSWPLNNKVAAWGK